MNSTTINFLELLNRQVQYVIPRWQRRYCWGQSDIERLVEDLLTVADDTKADASHYGGTMLTFKETGPAGVMETIRVVDGQQRLTTVSILLACIEAKLGPEGRCGQWTGQAIRETRLTNQHAPSGKDLKLRLQNGDEEEYRRGLDASPAGAGAVTQAWKIARRLVDRNDTARLLKGLERLTVVSIGLDKNDDPQQIFESLNATGRPLMESEKVKNWLLMGLPDAVQQQLHDTHWRRIERSLGAEHTTEPIDTFLRDLLRWRTGEVHGINRTYEGLRHWAVKHDRATDAGRSALCRELAHLAELYGYLLGTRKHLDAKVERALLHLRAIDIHTHRPLTLRLLNDAAESDRAKATHETLAKTLDGIGAWVTRLWLAGRPMAGLNKAIAELAHGPGPSDGEDVAEHWLGQIRKLRYQRVGVPDDEEVREGVRTRKAYGGSATRTTTAVLCAMMEAERPDEAPDRDRLTVEHVMPRKLTDEWQRYLGDDADEIHGRYRDRLANLTLSGDSTNTSMGAAPFDVKKKLYRNSPIGLTRRLAEETVWDEAALEGRAKDLGDRALRLWSWTTPEQHEDTATRKTASLQWRIDEGDWRTESAASRMVLNVASALLDRDPDNARRLSGESVSTNVHPASRYTAGSKAGALMMRAVPGHEDYVLCPYGNNGVCAERCRTMGKRCNVRIDVEIGEEEGPAQKFWRCLKKETGGVPGQKDTWKRTTQWTGPLNLWGDEIGIHLREKDERIWLHIWVNDKSTNPEDRAARLWQYSWAIQEQMSDLDLGDDVEQNFGKGRTITIQRPWSQDDEDEWPEAARWVKDQQERLQAIIEGQATEARP